MAKWALIIDGTVVETTDVDPAERFAPTLDWQPCAASVEVGYSYSNGDFEKPADLSLDAIKEQRVSDLRSACEAVIVGGFASDALGETHTYPSDIKAQINLMGSVTDSLMPNLPADWSTPFWVCDAQGNWKWEAHTASQIQHAGRNGKAAVVAAQTKLGELTAAVEAAKTKKAVEAIIW